MNIKWLAISLSVALLSTTSCSMVDTIKGFVGLGPQRTTLRTITIAADPEANQATATQIDVLLIYDDAVIDRLPKMGPDWFRLRPALQRSLATTIEVVSLEVPGDTAAFDVKLPAQITKATGVLVFANYVRENGWPVITLTPYRSASLRLMPNKIAVTTK